MCTLPVYMARTGSMENLSQPLGSDNSIPYASWALRYNSSDSKDSLIGDEMEDTMIAGSSPDLASDVQWNAKPNRRKLRGGNN
eukprot:765996-Hanusia_phi.AAC.2